MNKRIYLLVLLALSTYGAITAQTITTCAGDGSFIPDPGAPCPADGGQATATTLNMPNNVKVDGAGNQYIFTTGAGWSCFRIKKIDATGRITNAVGDGNYGGHYGDGGPASSAGIATYNAFCVDNGGNIYVSETWSKPSGYLVTSIRKVNSTTAIISTVAQSDTTGLLGDGGPASAATFSANDIVVDGYGNIFITEGTRIRKINPAGIITTVAGTGVQGYSGDGGLATNAQLAFPGQIVLDADGNIYFTDAADVSSPFTTTVLRKITSSGIISTLADTSIMCSYAYGLAYDNSAKCLYFSDQRNVVRKIGATGTISIVAGILGEAGYNGDNKPASSATLNGPTGVFVDESGNLFIADRSNYRVRKVSAHTAGISEALNASDVIELSPNPNNGIFSVKISGMNNEPVMISIFNSLGQLVKEIQSLSNNVERITLDKAPGFYFISITSADKHFNARVVIE